MFDHLYKAKLINLSKMKCPEEASWVNNPSYCCYHRLIGHSLTKCFVFKDKIMDLTRQDKILLEEDKVSANQTTIIFDSLYCPVGVLLSQFIWRNISFANEGIERSISQDDNKGWTLVIQRKNHKPKVKKSTSPTKFKIIKKQSMMKKLKSAIKVPNLLRDPILQKVR